MRPRHAPRAVLAATMLLALAACGDSAVAPTSAATAAPSPAASTTPGPTPSPSPSAAPTPACSTDGILATWSVTQLAEQTVVVPVDEGSVLTVLPLVRAGAGGVILFGSTAPSNLGQALAQLTAAAPGGIAPFVMTDEEGGAVQRLTTLVGDIPSARLMGQTMSAAAIQQLAQRLAQRMRANGVTMDLAPVLDADGGAGPDNRDPDGTRSFSADPRIAAADGVAFAEGLQAGGVVPVVKHFPGLGGATGNTDVTPAATLPWATLQTGGLVPFERAVSAGLPAVMISNATVPGLTTTPASLSSLVITHVLRTTLGFQGLVITDSLSATAINRAGYAVPAAAAAAILAGADMTLFTADASRVPSEVTTIVTAITNAVTSGALPRAQLQRSVARILSAKHVDLCG